MRWLRGATQPLFLVAYACFVGNVCEGLIIDIDHWRHFYLLMALVWGMMAAIRQAAGPPCLHRRAWTSKAVCRG